MSDELTQEEAGLAVRLFVFLRRMITTALITVTVSVFVAGLLRWPFFHSVGAFAMASGCLRLAKHFADHAALSASLDSVPDEDRHIYVPDPPVDLAAGEAARTFALLGVIGLVAGTVWYGIGSLLAMLTR